MCQVDTVLWILCSNRSVVVLRTVSCHRSPKLTATFVPGWRSWRYDLCSNRSVVGTLFTGPPKLTARRHHALEVAHTDGVIAITHSSCCGVVWMMMMHVCIAVRSVLRGVALCATLATVPHALRATLATRCVATAVSARRDD